MMHRVMIQQNSKIMLIQKFTSLIIIGLLTHALGTRAQLQKTDGKQALAVNTPTRYINTANSRIAYRTFGRGAPMILCNRLRGILDTWDPAFLDHLAKNNTLYIFDYPGIGLSTGKLAPTMAEVANDVKNLATALKIKKFNLLGWSYGGAVAQSFTAHYPEMVAHLILIGANPPGKNNQPVEQAFLDAAFKPVNDLQDEQVLFFEPASAKSVAAAKRSHQRIASRTKDLSQMVPPDKFGDYFKGIGDYQQDANQSREKLADTKVPIFILMGDHDPSCPVENWYPIIRKWKTANLLIIPQSGHGVQHEYPGLSAQYIQLFITRP